MFFNFNLTLSNAVRLLDIVLRGCILKLVIYSGC